MPENQQQKFSAPKVLSNDVIHLLLKAPSRQSLVPPGWEPGKGRTPFPPSTPELQPEMLYKEDETASCQEHHLQYLPNTIKQALGRRSRG